jgi:hypothetical protein
MVVLGEVIRLGLDTPIGEELGDGLLGLIFMACHPVLSKDARIALTLRVPGGLTTEEIARAFRPCLDHLPADRPREATGLGTSR